MDHGIVRHVRDSCDLYDLAGSLWAVFDPPGGGPSFTNCIGDTRSTAHALRRQWATLPEAEREQRLATFLALSAQLGANCDCEIYTGVLQPVFRALEPPPPRPVDWRQSLTKG